ARTEDLAPLLAGVAEVAMSGGADTDPAGRTRLSSDRLPLELARQRFGAIFDDVQLDRFVGREWLITRLDDALDRAHSGYIFVEAGAGLGKTTFVAWLVKTRDYPGHF